MSTSQRAVMLCGWEVKGGMACLQVKLCVAISERFRKCSWYLKALYKSPGLLFSGLTSSFLRQQLLLYVGSYASTSIICNEKEPLFTQWDKYEWWPGGVMVKALACDSRGRDFNSQPFRCQVTTLGKLFTHMCLYHQALEFGTIRGQ